jgi:hypothetical protein
VATLSLRQWRCAFYARWRAERRLERAILRPAATGTLLSGAFEHESGYISYGRLAVVDLVAAVSY